MQRGRLKHKAGKVPAPFPFQTACTVARIKHITAIKLFLQDFQITIGGLGNFGRFGRCGGRGGKQKDKEQFVHHIRASSIECSYHG